MIKPTIRAISLITIAIGSAVVRAAHIELRATRRAHLSTNEAILP